MKEDRGIAGAVLRPATGPETSTDFSTPPSPLDCDVGHRLAALLGQPGSRVPGGSIAGKKGAPDVKVFMVLCLNRRPARSGKCR